MAEKKGPNVNANKLAISRALGAAFLNHQVEQLEKSVTNGPGSGNWRDRKQAPPHSHSQPPQNAAKRPPSAPGFKVAPRKKGSEVQGMRPEKSSVKDRNSPIAIANGGPRSSMETKREKDATVVVVDASVLVHALYQVKKWCREGREEIVIVPLEALNTLDLLKKGTTSLAQRARAASRILEAQVGTNPRICVQRDDAFVLWDKIDFNHSNIKETEIKASASPHPSPEWVRRTICCARWEVENVSTTANAVPGVQDKQRKSFEGSNAKPKVVLAVLSSSPHSSPQAQIMKLSDNSPETHSPVPLPPPLHLANKHEPRSSGSLVAYWAAKAGISLLEVEPTIPGRGGEEEDRSKRNHPNGYGHGTRGHRGSSDVGGKTGLVERPPAVLAMMELVSQPSKVVRVLARGEKLEPGP